VKQDRLDWKAGLRARFLLWRKGRAQRLALFARAAIVFERAARVLTPAASVVALFIAVSWTGIWLGAPSFLRIFGVSALIGALVASLIRMRQFRWPSAGEARDALDAGDPAAPAAALADSLSNGDDPQTRGLWRLHQRHAESRAKRLHPILPSPRLWAEDPYALGALALLALFATGLLAGPEKYARVAAAFDWRWREIARVATRVDAWIDPPPYTGKPPVVLPLKEMGEQGKAVSAPVGSTIIVRGSNALDLRVTSEGGIVALPQPTDHDATSGERHFALRGDGSLDVAQGASHVVKIALTALPDLAPKITPLGAPKFNLHGSFELRYSIEDDYGARDAQASATPIMDEANSNAHPLVEPPHGALDLPPGPNGLGEGKTILDWSDSPYAGARVDLDLLVHDEAGNEGRSVIRNYVLPGRIFNNSLALALAEQRRLLALDARQKDRVLAAIDALTLSPEYFTPDAGVYLGLRFAHDSLRGARSDSDLRAVVDFLWEMALRIEEGDVPQAERDLKAAERALREALQRGASPEEIARLTEQLQKALNQYLAALQQKQGKESHAGEAEAGRGRTVTPKDLQSMLDQMAEAAKAGDKDGAMQMLDRLQNMLENLRAAQQNQGSREAAQSRKMMRDIDNMMREQQKLRDDTYTNGRENARNAAPRGRDEQEPGASGLNEPEQGGETARSADEQAGQAELSQRQSQLREKLEAMRRQAEKGQGTQPGGLGEAAEAMKQAENALKAGDNDQALSAQGRALEGLRKGAAEMAQGNDENGPGGDQEGAGQQNGRAFDGQNGEGRFGRANRLNSIDATAAQRARKVLEELRRRLSDPSRAREELDYLERLIKPD